MSTGIITTTSATNGTAKLSCYLSPITRRRSDMSTWPTSRTPWPISLFPLWPPLPEEFGAHHAAIYNKRKTTENRRSESFWKYLWRQGGQIIVSLWLKNIYISYVMILKSIRLDPRSVYLLWCRCQSHKLLTKNWFLRNFQFLWKNIFPQPISITSSMDCCSVQQQSTGGFGNCGFLHCLSISVFQTSNIFKIFAEYILVYLSSKRENQNL